MLSELIQKIEATDFAGKRRLVALVGPPASGKSTLAEALAESDPSMQVVPMDGFHLDNALLIERGLLHRKGAPETFDALGFVHLIARLHAEEDVIFPHFDRTLDKSIAGAGQVRPKTKTILVEGNYLMLDQPIWRDLAPLWDLSIGLNVNETVLRDRLYQRWLKHGYNHDDATAKVNENDMVNAAFVAMHAIPTDIVISTSDLA